MRKYIIKRILISIVILFFVAFVIYALMRCLPTSYVEAMARQKSMQPGSKSFEEWMAQLTHMYNLDVGIVPGFFKWLGQMLTFQFGDSWLWTKPVTEVFNNCVWISFFMGLIAFVLEIIIAIPLGVIAATKQYSKTDYVISVLALAGISLPTFFFASLLKLVFSVRLGWFDLYGLTGRSHQQLSAFGKLLDMGHHLVLPIVTLVVISVGSLMRYTRTNMLEVLNADYIRTARAKGLKENTIIMKHALRNALIPVVTLMGLQFGRQLSGVFVIETIFAIPGMGKMLVDACSLKNIPIVQGGVIFIAVIYGVINLLVDIIYGFIDPRISSIYRRKDVKKRA